MPVPCIRWITRGAANVTLLNRPRLRFGRSSEADVQLLEAGVSRLHAEVFVRGRACALADTSSKNGVFINGELVTHAALAPGDVVRLGNTIGVVDDVTLPAEAGERLAAPAVSWGLPAPGLARALGDLPPVAESALPVVIIGETGVGKERVATAIHLASRRKGPLHSLNCAAIAQNLAEAELFGHRKGAFTGADTAAVGHLRAAHGGTLFLDELQDLPLRVQATLLRVLQDGVVVPVGETKPIPVDIRVIAASQQPLAQLIASGRLREDLVMRLSGFTLTLPPLRERRADVGLLFYHFLEQYAVGVVPEVEVRCIEELLLYGWPGNVRELELLARRLLALQAAEGVIRWRALPEIMRTERAHSPRPEGGETRDEHDRRKLRDALRRSEGNVKRAALAVGISRQRAYRLMGEHSVAEFSSEQSGRERARAAGVSLVFSADGE